MRTLLVTILLTLAASSAPCAQQAPDIELGESERAAVTEAALAALDQSYVFPETALRMREAIRARAAAGEYASLTSGREFARTITEHLQAVSKDKHLRIWLADEGAASARTTVQSTNHGFGKVERLPGNIGYVELRSFLAEGPEAEDAAMEAMNTVADTDALIFDLRANGGGSPAMVAMVSSYLFDRPTHLNSLYWREGDRTDEFWTTRLVKGKRFGERKPVFVLTSKRTFSGAEEFSYNLKNLKRATIVGETTGGGANPGAIRRIDARFSMFIPTGRAINPVTRTNWEVVGVVPDVPVPAEKALEKALELAAAAVRAS